MQPNCRVPHNHHKYFTHVDFVFTIRSLGFVRSFHSFVRFFFFFFLFYSYLFNFWHCFYRFITFRDSSDVKIQDMHVAQRRTGEILSLILFSLHCAVCTVWRGKCKHTFDLKRLIRAASNAIPFSSNWNCTSTTMNRLRLDFIERGPVSGAQLLCTKLRVSFLHTFFWSLSVITTMQIDLTC